MRKIALSVVAIVGMSSFGFAGGDIAPVEPVVVVTVVEEDMSNFYAGLGLVYQRTYSTDSVWFSTADTMDDTGGIVGVAGYNFNEYLSVEGRISKSFSGEDYADVTAYSLFLKPQYPVSEDFSVYGLLGYGLVQVDGTNGDAPAATPGATILDESGFQWGVGASYVVMENFSIFVDYTRLMTDEDINSRLYANDPATYSELSVDGITAGVTYNF